MLLGPDSLKQRLTSCPVRDGLVAPVRRVLVIVPAQLAGNLSERCTAAVMLQHHICLCNKLISKLHNDHAGRGFRSSQRLRSQVARQLLAEVMPSMTLSGGCALKAASALPCHTVGKEATIASMYMLGQLLIGHA